MMNDLPEEAKRRRRETTKKAPKQGGVGEPVGVNAKVPESRFPKDRFKQINAFVDDELRFIKNKTHAVVWFAIWRHTRHGNATISHSRLEAQIGVSNSTIKRAIKVLFDTGYLKKVKQGGLVTGTNQYQPCFPDEHGKGQC